MYRLGRPAPRGSMRRGGGEGRARPPHPAPARPPGAGSRAGAAHSRTHPGRAGRGKRRRDRVDYLGVLIAPAPLHASSRPLLQLLLQRGEARLRKRAAQPERQNGARQPGTRGSRLRIGSGPLRVDPDGRGLWASGDGKGARVRAQGLYVNGDSGGGRGEGSGAAGRAR